jgi:hypothetical protein
MLPRTCEAVCYCDGWVFLSLLSRHSESGRGRGIVGILLDALQMYGRIFEDPEGHIWEAMWMSEEARERGSVGGREEVTACRRTLP